MKTASHTLLPVALVIAGLALIEPALHTWIAFYPPEGAAATGLHTGDSGHHLVSMRAFANGLYSPFASCLAADQGHGLRYYAVPIFLLYAILGEVGRALPANDFLVLGFANGIAAALYLIAVYRFLVTATPRHGRRAFFLFALGGGIGGPLYWIAAGLGWTHSADFEQHFMRLAQYTLIEGQHPAPYLQFTRFYYTLPLAFGFWSLKVFADALRIPCTQHALYAGLLLAFPAFFNLRLGPMFAAIALLYLLTQPGLTPRFAWAHFRPYLVVCALSTVAGWSAMQLQPVYGANVRTVASGVALFLPLVYAIAPALLPALPGARNLFASLHPRWFLPLAGAAGYLAVYAIACAGHQAYYGNYLAGGDTAAAATASVFALLGPVPAMIFAARLRPKTRAPIDELDPAAEAAPAWALVWLAVFLLAAIAGSGGLLNGFGPARFMVLLGVPLAVVAAVGLETLTLRWRAAALALIYGCGGASILAGALFFQGPLGATPGKGPFAYLHYEYMSTADQTLLQALPEGRVALPPWSPIAFGEIVAVQGRNAVLGGPGALNLGDQPFGEVQEAVARIFAADTPAEDREVLLQTWCVDFVYLPDTCTIAGELRAALEHSPGLSVLAQEGGGVLFRVNPPMPRAAAGPARP